jgi:hypothetical protein
MDLKSLIPECIIEHEDYWFYLDSYNQVWKIIRHTDPYLPLRISLHEKLTNTFDKN